MLKIGDFSRLAQVPVKTLRYYDELGLLSPARVDPFTGYRYYTVEQLPRLNRLLALKDLGFALEQVAPVLDEGISPEQLRGMLRLRQVEQQARVHEEQARLARVLARLSQIEQETTMPTYDVVLKTVAPVRVAAVRAIIPTYAQQGHLWAELGAYLQAAGAAPAGPCLTRYFEDGYTEREVDAEVCQPLRGDAAGTDRVQVYDLPAGQLACVVHHGPFATLTQAYTALIRWIEANGYRMAGPAREVYLQTTGAGNQNDPDCVTEVQMPVERAAPVTKGRPMSKLDYKREARDLYTASAKTPAWVTVPALNFLMLDGRGDPNTSAEYQAAVEALFAAAYAIKFQVKRQAAVDYGVLPLEGLWWVADLRDLDDRAKWQWTMMIRQPAPVTAALVRAMLAEVAAKKDLPALGQVRFEKYAEGRAAQVLHLGPYAAEKPTIDRLHDFIRAGGQQLRGRHHEVYLSDARKTAPAKLKTIIRQPVEKA